MSAPQPKTKAQEIVERYAPLVANVAWPTAELTVRRAIAEATAALKDASLEARGHLWSLIGYCKWRLADRRGSLDAYKNASSALPNNAQCVNGIGVALLELGQVEAAIQHLEKARGLAKDAPDALAMALGNLAEAQHRLGHSTEARSLLLAMIAVPQSVPSHLFLVATQAATIEAHDTAVEFLARYVAAMAQRERGEGSALEWLEVMSEEVHERIKQLPALQQSIETVRSWQHAEEGAAPGDIQLEPETWKVFEALVSGNPRP